jgi:AcrR family transcriptional regulator
VDDQDQRQQAKDQARENRARAREEHARAWEERERDHEQRMRDRVSAQRASWTRPPRRARGLSREDIVCAAIAVADAEGTDAVSMRRIARELGVGAMSLYWYVASKDELQLLMLDAVQPELPAPSGNWRADLEAFARAARAEALRHPWSVDYLASGPPVGPNDARNNEWLIAMLDGLGLDIKTAIWIAMTVGTYVAGTVLREIQEIRWHRSAEEMKAAIPPEELDRLRERFAEEVGDPERYPHMARLIAEGIDPDSPDTRDERFEFGLDCLLDGIATRFSPPRG